MPMPDAIHHGILSPRHASPTIKDKVDVLLKKEVIESLGDEINSRLRSHFTEVKALSPRR
jgi:hypothetical protein